MDPLAALAPRPVDVDLGAYTYTIEALPARPWIEAVMAGTGGGIIPGLLGYDDRASIWGDFASLAVDERDIMAAERAALTAAAGRPWWQADRLIRGALHSDSWPTISGEMVQRAIDVQRISLAAWLNWVFMFAYTHAKDDNARSMFVTKLEMIPADALPEVAAAGGNGEAEDFMAALAEFGGQLELGA